MPIQEPSADERDGAGEPAVQPREALKAAVPATGAVTCPRCGSFVDALLDAPISVCRPCGERLLPAPLRGPLTLAGITHGTGLVLRSAGIPCVLLALAFSFPGDYLFSRFPEAPFQLQTAYGLVTLIADLGVMVLAHEALHGRSISVWDALVRGVPRYGAVFGARFRAGILAILWALLLIVPGIYKAAAYSIAAPIALFEPRLAGSATDVSITRTQGIVPLLLAVQLPLFVLAVLGPMLVWVALGIEAEESGVSLPEDLYVVIGVVLGAFSTLAVMLLTIVEQVVYAKTALDARLGDSAVS